VGHITQIWANGAGEFPKQEKLIAISPPSLVPVLTRIRIFDQKQQLFVSHSHRFILSFRDISMFWLVYCSTSVDGRSKIICNIETNSNSYR
jgi:hypothetical protein